ncbi:proteasome complex subunit Rpn13 ubiquitin receptor-domain-containing protein [Dimargaris cristalligena]|uniref:Proteasome complex subunit Rpn13 ubiquitin receptor-domain-containing protein n=1 Tax=Dimargaris cristalligena TaxID=215637 RepID=A0A4P9ZWH3_9FUNG|nr:proteasome complex subunit Rpn13 ubiquitin receptor-domain-containing protein [Dimargaris cristalligena]|eukprot:RKP37311.1 proteasome complex subunit Rpn13 ubiquitin receptor-domain-containing protein [Dimargaris cristalligena]
MASALFSQPTRTGHSSSYINGSPVQFKAGRLFRDGTTNWVKADPRKGLIFMRQADDGLMHFYWKDRRSHQIEEDLIIFPEDAEFIKCQQSEDRVYLLKFKSSSQRLFFWMQGSNLDRDAEACRRVNRLLNATVYPSESDHHAAGASEDAAMPGLVDEAALTDMARSVDHLLVPDHESPSGGSRGAGGAHSSTDDVDLPDVLSPETLNTLLADPEVCTALFPYLPESPGAEAPASGRGSSATPTPSTPHQRSPQEVRQIVRSPPFQHALRSLSYALQTGQLGPLIQQLGLPHDASYSVESFLRAIENQVKQESGTNQSSSQQSDNMDEDL